VPGDGRIARGDATRRLVLRRAVFISGGRQLVDLQIEPSMRPIGGCWVWQPERIDEAQRISGAKQEFTGRREALTADDQAWLAFRS